MKRILTISLRMLTVLGVLQLSSCQKIIDMYFYGKSSGGSSGNSCRIIKVVQDAGSGDLRTGSVHYNDYGDPDSVIFDKGLGYAKDYYFRYDDHHRLIAYDSYYRDHEPGSYYFKHKYGYRGDRIVSDTDYISVAGSYTEVSSFEYDNQGRIVTENRKIVEQGGMPANDPEDPFTYTYDANGNLVSASDEVSDDKVSYLRTSRIWMFIQRNYSTNNIATASGYNSHNLPFGFPTPGQQNRFLQYGDPTEIDYECN